MGGSESKEAAPSSSSSSPETNPGSAGGVDKKQPACKACCACPETKKARDACIMEQGEENCGELIEAHKKCMRDMGFNI